MYKVLFKYRNRKNEITVNKRARHISSKHSSPINWPIISLAVEWEVLQKSSENLVKSITHPAYHTTYCNVTLMPWGDSLYFELADLRKELQEVHANNMS